MKNDDSNFAYDPLAASRLQCRMVPYGPQSYAPQGALSTDAYQYRASSLSAYQYPLRPHYSGVPTFAEYADENFDYGLQASPYSLMNADHLAIPSNYGTSSVGRDWTPTPQVPKSTSLFLEQDPVYNQPQLPYQPHNGFPLRQTISPENKSVSLNRAVPSLPAPINGNDRVLPYPAAQRPTQGGSFLRSSDNLIPTTQPGFQSYNGLMSSNILASVKAANSAAVSENASLSPPYLPMTSTSPESLSSQLAYSSHSLPMSQQSSEMYTPSQDSMFHANDSSDSAYDPTTSGSKRGSQSSHTSTAESSLPSYSNGNLANERAYVPYTSQSYPARQMDMNPAAPPQRRVSAVQAV